MSCVRCESSGRLRALAWLIADELFGSPLTFPEFPSIQSWTALGMSDLDDFAAPLRTKFQYTNTYYHKPPLFDVTKPDTSMEGRFDFIISSEVLEHVPYPVAPAFETLYRMLKPDGILFLTVPYSLRETTKEHFTGLHDYSVVQLRGSWVLVNRTADGRLQTFDNLVFHGGPGSTLEMRVFNEATLRQMLSDAGFGSIRIAGESCAEFGILPDDPWSLPIAARKGKRAFTPVAWDELAGEYKAAKDKLRVTSVDLANRNANYAEHVDWANEKIAALERESAERLSWGREIEHTAEERLAHIGILKESLAEAEESLGRITAEFDERTRWALEIKARLDQMEQSRWLKLGRRLRLTKIKD